MEQILTLELYKDDNGKIPFYEWKCKLDLKTQARIEARLDRVQHSNFGDCDTVGEGIFELRFHFGAGYRIYFSKEKKAIVLLLCGGNKSTQKNDIIKAKKYLDNYKRS